MLYWIFPTLLVASDLTLSVCAPFYRAFVTKQKHEYLAWINTVFFQTTATALYWVNPTALGPYFLAYTIHDTLHLTFYTKQKLYYLHHLLSATIALMTPPIYAPYVMTAGAFLECSNILLGTTWLLTRAGYKANTLGGVSVAVYLFLRNVCFPYYLFWYTPRPVQIMMSVFIPMNIFWSWKVIRYIQHR